MRETLVADDRYLYTRNRREAHNCASLADLLIAAEQLGISHMWIVPGSRLSQIASRAGELAGWSVAASYQERDRARYNYISARRAEKRHEDRIQIGFPEFHYWPWRAHTPRDLYYTIAHLEALLDLPIEWSPAHVGLEFVRKSAHQHWDWFAPCSIDLEQELAGFKYANACPELRWCAPLPPGAQVIIKIDKNSSYPAACTGLRLGEGDPILVSIGQTAGEYDERRPGFWYCDISLAQSLFDGRRAPALSGRRYLTTDLVRQLRTVGYHINIISGACWPRYHQALRAPMTDLWHLRQHAKKRRQESVAWQNVYASISGVMHAIPGRLGDLDATDRHFRRRDWWALIVARATATIISNIHHIYTSTGLLPVLISMDALWYAAPCADPGQALPGVLDRDKLGGYKDVYALPITDEIREWFASGKQVIARLNERAQQKQEVF